MFCFFFFFKQKTAYELRISDWSSDVCSSDLDQVPTTYPRLASLIGFIPADRVIACSDAVMAVQRDYGDRKERLYARFKYTVDAKGLDWIKAEIEQRMGEAFELARPFHLESNGARYGWTENTDGRQTGRTR